MYIFERLNNISWFYFTLLLISVLTALVISTPLFFIVSKSVSHLSESAEILINIKTFQIVVRSLLLAVTTTIFSLLISLPLSWLLQRVSIHFRRFWLVVSVIPLVIPSYVGGFLLLAALGPKGIIQQQLSIFGIERLPEVYGFWGAAIVLTLLRFPYMFLPLYSSLSKINPSLEEVSSSLGKRKTKTYFNAVLPQLKPAIATGSLLVSLSALTDFGAVSLLNYETFTWAIYLQYQSAFNFNVAASLSTVVLIISSIFLIAELKINRKGSNYNSPVATRKLDKGKYKIGLWIIPSYIFMFSLFLVSIVVPIFVLSYWVYFGLKNGQTFPDVFTMVINSLTISLISAFVIILISFPIAYFSVRYNRKIHLFIERITYIGFSLPGVVVALSLVFVGINFLTIAYQTHFLLVVAYLILFLPVSTGAIRDILLTVNINLENSARSLGKNQFIVVKDIVLPLVKTGILTGFVLSFLLIMRELPATLILSPLGFKTLATGIWSYTSEAFLAKGAMCSLVLIVTASLPMLYLLSKKNSF